MVDIPVGRSSGGRGGPVEGTPVLSFRTGESYGQRRWANGDYSSQGQRHTPAGDLRYRRPGFFTGVTCGWVWGDTPSEGCCSRLRGADCFGIVGSTTWNNFWSGCVVTSGSRKLGPFRVCSERRHRITHQIRCARTSLRGAEMTCTLDIANPTGREGHS